MSCSSPLRCATSQYGCNSYCDLTPEEFNDQVLMDPQSDPPPVQYTPVDTCTMTNNTLTLYTAYVGGTAGSFTPIPFTYTGVADGPCTLYVNISGTNGDADLYVRKDAAPTRTNYTWYPAWPSSNEYVAITIEVNVTYYFGVGASGTSGFGSLIFRVSTYGYRPNKCVTTNNEITVYRATGISKSAGTFYQVPFTYTGVSGGPCTLLIKIAGADGNADLYLKLSLIHI